MYILANLLLASTALLTVIVCIVMGLLIYTSGFHPRDWMLTLKYFRYVHKLMKYCEWNQWYTESDCAKFGLTDRNILGLVVFDLEENKIAEVTLNPDALRLANYDQSDPESERTQAVLIEEMPTAIDTAMRALKQLSYHRFRIVLRGGRRRRLSRAVASNRLRAATP